MDRVRGRLLVFCLSTRLSLHWQILLGTLLGIGFGRAVRSWLGRTPPTR